MAVDVAKVEEACKLLLEAIGEDPSREGLRDTPARWGRWWKEFVDHPAGSVDTTFESKHVNQMVVVGPLRVWSLCEHHLLPFWCDVHIGYIPSGRVLGLSKFGRIARKVASRLQLQERLVDDIAVEVGIVAASPDVAVVARGEHTCMSMRGVRMSAMMTTSVVKGSFKESIAVRSEFLRLCGLA